MIEKYRAVEVAQLAEQLLPTLEVSSSNSAIGKNYILIIFLPSAVMKR